MDMRRILFLGVAIILAGGIAMSVRSAARPPQPAAEVAVKPVNLPSILVAKVNLPAGNFVVADQLSWVEWPSEKISDAYIKKDSRNIDEFVGAVIRTGIAAGEPISEGRLIKKNDRGFMAAVLNPGMRAVSVTINETTGISGFIFPGDKVDVILTQSIQLDSESGNKKPRKASETILTNVRVLAVDQRTDDQKPEAKVAKTATLEVTPKQAEKLALVADLGKISLSLRSLSSDNESQTDEAGSSYTWDSDASVLLSSSQKPTITSVVRGEAVEDVILTKGGT